ncbi:hypothetical protein TNCV_398211 [Trichonephila clavipes]|nr:hypothetical protein TNCV_398211 [Trichonephila clavipes]
MVLLTNLESFTLNKSVVSLTSLEFTRGTASKMNSIAARLPKIAFPSDTLSPLTIVRVHYFVRGGFAGNRSRASSKHLSPHLPVDGARFLGGQKGFCCTCKLHVWLSGLQRNRPDVDVFEKHPVDGTCPSEQRSRDENDASAGTPPFKIFHRTNGRIVNHDSFNVRQPIQLASRLELTSRWSRMTIWLRRSRR